MRTSIVPQIKFEDVELHPVVNPQFDFLLTNKEVAKGYGISESTLRSNKNNHADELVEGKHYIIDRSYRNTPKIMWTKRGIIRLGFFIKSERAKKFRDFIEDLTLAVIDNQPPTGCLADQFDSRIAGYKGMLARKNKEIERLRFELIQVQEKVKELEKHSLHDKIFFDTNSIDLAGGIARHNIMLNAAADHLEMIAKDLRERASHTQYFLDNLLKFFPKAKDTVEKVKKYYRRIYPPYIT